MHVSLRTDSLLPNGQERALMTAIASFLRKTPVTRLQDYFSAGGFTSLPPVDWTRPESEVVEPLIKAVDDMNEDGTPQRRLVS